MKIILFDAVAEIEIDKVDLNFVQNYSWRLSNNGYIIGKAGKYHTRYLHKIIAERAGLDVSNLIDHKDGNPLNNQRNNLRPATRKQDSRNHKRQSNNISGYKGVYWCKQGWRAVIRVDGRCIHLGYFNIAERAHLYYCIAAIKYFGEFARFE